MLATLKYLKHEACFQNRSSPVISDRYKQSTGVTLFSWAPSLGLLRGAKGSHSYANYANALCYDASRSGTRTLNGCDFLSDVEKELLSHLD